MKKIIVIIIALNTISFSLYAQSVGDYRSINSGNWNDATKWEIYNGSNWVNTLTYPGQDPGTGTVTIMNQTEIKITASVLHPVSSIYISGEYFCSCWDESYTMVFGTLTFSAQNTASLVVSGSVTVFGKLGVDDQAGTKNHSLFIGGSVMGGDSWSDYEYYYMPTVFQTINHDDKLHVIFNTTVPGSSIMGEGISFQEVTFNGIGISLFTYIVVNHANFINGIVWSNGSINFTDDATFAGASNASHVAGMVGKLGDDPFTFPIGNGDIYAPLTISAPASQGASVSVSYTRSNASDLGSISDPALFNVSNCEYWSLNTNNSNLNVTVNWSNESGCGFSPYVSNVSEVTLAHFDYTTQKWDNHGGSGIGTSTNSSVTWNGVNSDGYVTLGNLGACNAPWGNAVNITSNSATLSWTAISGAASYDIDYKPTYNSSEWISGATAISSTSLYLSELNPLMSYEWRIRTNCGSSSSSYRQRQFQTLCGPLTGLITTNITANSATLSWSASSIWVTYNVEYKQSTSPTWVPVATNITSSSYILNGLIGGVGYDWRVLANCTTSIQGGYTQSSFTTVMPTICNDVYETNNNSNQAKTINTGSIISAMISSGADVDWFKITTPNNPNTRLEIVLSNLPADYDLYVYNKNLKLVVSSINTGTLNEVVIYNSNARKATYFIKVAGKNGAYNSSQCYSLIAEVSSIAGSISSASNPNNEIIEASTNQMLYPNPASEFVFLRFNSNIEVASDIQIFNTSGQLVKRYPVNIIRGNNQVRIPVNDLKPGVYLLRINKGELSMIRKFVIAG